mmetsp:Transcript_3977/g.14063  ORF Transcript_3977/g.14063 Transcript_3977/m.14063 type:complete len:261 (+) Transcript_3977:1016-1798(+)
MHAHDQYVADDAGPRLHLSLRENGGDEEGADAVEVAEGAHEVGRLLLLVLLVPRLTQQLVRPHAHVVLALDERQLLGEHLRRDVHDRADLQRLECAHLCAQGAQVCAGVVFLGAAGVGVRVQRRALREHAGDQRFDGVCGGEAATLGGSVAEEQLQHLEVLWRRPEVQVEPVLDPLMDHAHYAVAVRLLHARAHRLHAAVVGLRWRGRDGLRRAHAEAQHELLQQLRYREVVAEREEESALDRVQVGVRGVGWRRDNAQQ